MNASECLVQISRMVGTVQFFPAQQEALTNMATEAARFVEDKDKLTWLVDVFINHVGEWKGIKEFRAVYCTRFRPMDGVEEYSGIHGFSPGDIEAGHIESSERFKYLEKGDDQRKLIVEGLRSKQKKRLN